MFSNLVIPKAESKERKVVPALTYDLDYYVAPQKSNYPSVDGWYKTNGFQAFHRADKTHTVSAMGIYDWIKSMDVSVLNAFKCDPSSVVSITFVVPETLANMAKQKFDHTEFFEPNWKDLTVDKIPGIQRGKQLLLKLQSECDTCGQVFDKYKQDTQLKKSKTIEKFLQVQSDEVTMDMINLIPQYVIGIKWNTL